MKIDKRSGLVRGGVNLNQKLLLYPSQNRQMGRSCADSIRMSETEEAKRTRVIFDQVVGASLELTESQRAVWAIVFPYSAYLRELHDSARLPHIMHKHVIVPVSWRHAFIFSNMCAAYANLPIIRFRAPGQTPPPVPLIKAVLDLSTFKVSGEIKIYRASKKLRELVLRLWLGMQYVTTIRGSIHMLFNISDRVNYDGETIVPFSIDYIRCAGRAFGVDTLALRDIMFGRVYLWVDCVGAYGPQSGAKCSPYSNLAVMEMLVRTEKFLVGKDANSIERYSHSPKPGVDVSEHAMNVLNRVVGYRREIEDKRKRRTTRVVRVTDWRTPDQPTEQKAIIIENPSAPKTSSIKIYDKYGNEMK